MHYAEQIIADFSDEEASNYVYKIVGLRGSGKSVEYGKVLNEFRTKKGWLVYSLSAAGNPTETLIAKLSSENFIDSNEHSKSISGDIEIGGDIKLVNSSASVNYIKARKKGYKVLVGIDDICKTADVVKVLSKAFPTLFLTFLNTNCLHIDT